MPDVTFNLAFHFQEDTNGNNFTCDTLHPEVVANPGATIYAPNLVTNIISRLNGSMTAALLLNGGNEDAKIRFKLNGTGDCGSALFFYPQGGSPTFVPGAMNVNFVSTDVNDTSSSGYAYFGQSTIVLENMVNDWFYGEKNKAWWNVADLMGHEFGHTRCLDHTYYSGNPCNGVDIDCAAECAGNCYNTVNPPSSNPCFGSSSRTLMMGSGHGYTKMTECEFGEMWNYMINNPDPYQEIEFCDLPPNNDRITYDVNSTIVWDNKKKFTKHVTIATGTTVTIDCEVFMGADKEILVEDGAKLIVQGGKITSICETPWRGIKVYGGSDSYAVEIKGGSTIENVSQGAVSMFHDGGWLLGNGNAHVKIEGSTFNDCNRILGMGSINNVVNLSIVEGNVQNGGKYGVTNWNCLNVRINDNHFNDITKSCIVSSGQALIRGNTFRGFESDILFPSESPTVASIIEDNDFYANQVGISMLGAGISQHRILKNRFHSNIFNVWMDGDNHFLIDENSFKGQIGGIFVNNGSNFNLVRGNDIYTDRLGLRMHGENNGFVINSNCYLTSQIDNYITGSIGDVQGAAGSGGVALRPANNCFTHQGSIASPVEDLFGTTNDFLYIEPKDFFNDCRDAVKAEPNIQIEELGASRKPCPNNQADEPTDPCDPIRELNSVTQSLNELESIINGLSESSVEYDIYTGCHETVRGIWLELILEQEEYDQLRVSLADVQTDDAKLIIYKSYLIENDFNSAEEYLLSLTSSSEKLSDFATLQLINLKRIKSNLRYEVSNSELNNILEIATKDHPYAAYGKSLYFWITGELLQSEVKMFPDLEAHERSSIEKEEDIELQLNVFPIPFSNKLNIEFIHNLSENSTIVIDDILGTQLYKLNSGASNFSINTSKWDNGIYILSIYNEGKLIKKKKLLLIK